MTIYIAGPITGIPDYKRNFNQAENGLLVRGYNVLNPAKALSGLNNAQAIRICFDMIDAADAVLFLPDWEYSAGANLELAYCKYTDKTVYYKLEEVPNR